MGNKLGSKRSALSEELTKLATSVFQQIDTDGSFTIDMKESAEWWADNFSIINSRALFEAVDADHNGEISFTEWLEFWQLVKHQGHTDEEIEEELMNIRKKGSWCQFVACPKVKRKR